MRIIPSGAKASLILAGLTLAASITAASVQRAKLVDWYEVQAVSHCAGDWDETGTFYWYARKQPNCDSAHKATPQGLVSTPVSEPKHRRPPTSIPAELFAR